MSQCNQENTGATILRNSDRSEEQLWRRWSRVAGNNNNVIAKSATTGFFIASMLVR